MTKRMFNFSAGPCTLPLPILEKGDYLHDGDLEHAEKLLKAAALTYVAGSLASLLNLGRWIAVFRR